MNREILFRAKQLDNGEWVEGSYFKSPGIDEFPDRHYIVRDEGAVDSETFTVGFYKVDPATVCEYTGLTDRNGRKIFEGDIIRYEKKLYSIDWAKGCAHFAAHNLEKTPYTPILTSGTMEHVEVCGNIFDNPDLLEGGMSDA